MFSIFAGFYYWFGKMSGRQYPEWMGKVHFALTFLFSNCTFYPMHIIGVGGHPRRYYDSTLYDVFQHLQPLNVFMSISAILLGFTQFIFVANFFYSLFWGKPSGQNPWHTNSLEWAAAPSPPPHGNFVETPIVYRGPYEYGHPDAEEDYITQTDVKAPAVVAAH